MKGKAHLLSMLFSMKMEKLPEMFYTGYVFFNTKDPAIFKKWPDKKFVWLPKDGSQQYIIDYVISKESVNGKNFKIEKVFEYNPSNSSANIEFIDLDKQVFSKKRKLTVAFFAASDTIATSFLPLILNSPEIHKIVYTAKLTKENAECIFENQKISFKRFSFLHFFLHRPDIIFFCNDWSSEARLIIKLARIVGVKSVCMQESIVDFGGPLRRMQWSDLVFVQGATTILELKRKVFFIVGNPRYERLDIVDLPKEPKAFINCNFTYGIHEDIREAWLKDVVTALEKRNIDYFISQHPRDTADLGAFKNVKKSNASLIHSQLRECSFVITRFSSVIHEALCLGRKVIYYNPHNEKMQYDFGFDNEIIIQCHNKEDLSHCVGRMLKPVGHEEEKKIRRYLSLHCKLMNFKLYDELEILEYAYGLKGDSCKDTLLSAIYNYVK
jgi:hypothetical protein